MDERILRKIGIVVGIGDDGAALVKKLGGMPRRRVPGAGVCGDRPALLQALHADGSMNGHRLLELLGVAIVIGVDTDRQRGVGTPGGLILADHQRARFRGTQPVHVTHVIPGLILTQPVEIKIVINDLTARLALQIARDTGIQRVEHHGARVDEHVDMLGKPPFTTNQAERIALADGQRADRQHSAADSRELHTRVFRLAGGKDRNGEPLMMLADRQIATRRSGRRAAGIIHGYVDIHCVRHRDPPVGHVDGGVERGIAQRHRNRTHRHGRQHDRHGKQLMPAQPCERHSANDGKNDNRPAKRGHG